MQQKQCEWKSLSIALTAGWDLDRASPHFPHTSVGAEVITGAWLSMSFIKSLVILSNSSTSRIERGTPPGSTPAPGPLGCAGRAEVELTAVLPYGDVVEDRDAADLGRGEAGGGNVFS